MVSDVSKTTPPPPGDPLREAVFTAIDDATGESSGYRVIDTDAFFSTLKDEGYEVVKVQ